MFCEQCGTQIGEGSAFCENCGAKVQQQPTENAETAQSQTTFTEPENGFVPPTPQEPFSKKLLNFIIAKKALLISAIVVILVITLSVSMLPYAKNSFMKIVKSPEGYFQYVVDNNTADFAENTASTIGRLKDGFLDEAGAKAALSLEVEDEFYDVLDDFTGEDLGEYLNWLKSASLNLEGGMEDDKFSAEYSVELNGEDIGTIDLVADIAKCEYYTGVPDYNKDYVYMDMSSEMDPDDLEEAMKQFELLAEALPDDGDLEDMFSRYISCIAKSVDDVKQSSDTLTVDGISQKATKLSVDITGDIIVNAAKNVVEEAMKDKDLKEFIEDIEVLSDLSYSNFKDALETALDELNDVDLEEVDDAKITLELYVNGKGEIIGIVVSTDEGEFVYAVAKKGGKFGFELSLSADGGSVALEGNGKVSDSKYSGDFKVKALGFTAFEFTTVNFDADSFSEGILNGKIAFEIPAVPQLRDFNFIIDCKSSSTEKAEISIIVEHDEEKIATLSCKVNSTGAPRISMPGDYVDANDYDAMEKWVENFDIDELCDALRDADVPDEFVDAIESNLH